MIAAGLLLAPQGLGSLLARVTGPLTDRLGPRPVTVAGMLLCALGTLPSFSRTPARPCSWWPWSCAGSG